MNTRILSVIFLFITTISFAQVADPLDKLDTYGQNVWVDSIMKTLTIDEKIGQLFMIPAYSNRDAQHEADVNALIKKYHIGGLVFFQGTPEKQIQMTNVFQNTSKIPLLVGFDGEWGLDMRLDNTYRFPWNMTLGAIQDESLIEEFGEMLGKHHSRIGIHVNFAPVVDVNINPANPIIGNRSFGEDPKNVASKAIAFTKGMQSQNVLANAKHFPGHGDTDADSHLTLPTIPFSKQRLDSVELYPYKELFKNGLASVMVAHLSVPEYEPNAKLPSSLSKNIVTDLLKEKMGFKGLIFTDALNMKGAANFSSSAEINLEVIKAGNDILLMPEDIPASFAKLQQAVADSIISVKRLDESVKKILKAKYWAGLKHFKPIELNNLHEDINGQDAEMLHYKLVENATTLLKNELDLFPVKDLAEAKIAYVKLGDDDNTTFINRLNDYTQVDVISGKNLDDVIKKLKAYNLVIIGYHKSNASAWKGFKFTNKELVWLQEIARNNRVILDVFASAYSLLDVKTFTNIESILVSYQNSKISQDVSAQQIFGALSAKGRLPVSINNDFAVGSGLNSTNLFRLSYGVPEEVGMDSKKLERLDSLAQEVVKAKMAPGLQLLVAKKGKVIYRKSFGYHTDKKETRVQNNHIYDLASITKILGGLPLIMKAEEEGKISLNTPIGKLFKVLDTTDKKDITVKEALSHYARLQSWIPYYLRTIDSATQKASEKYYRHSPSKEFSIQVANKLYLRTDYKDSMYQAIADAPLLNRKRYKYSGLIFYLFKDYFEKEYKQTMDVSNNSFFYKPLGATTLTYKPLEKFPKQIIVPTERDLYFRNQLLHGYVHDQGAAMFGGVNGNAGLFANANDVAKMMQMYMQEGYYGGKRYFKGETIRKFNKRYYSKNNVRRGLGFDKPQINPREKATCGCVSPKSFGHSGYTGTYTWADPETELVYVFLSNRVYPTATNSGLVKYNIRTVAQQIIQDAIVDK
ncbi:glycoside hydrolase family 3 N-terminal domain-containing protein [Aureibaculum sp. 2210JD6-5]|uniref:glycoside hydrolase family 3 N-terminal domain-containing protein n=1 Tax=Aureibaculum sp. 2210JD6-5 TaxID=3103957 RepID=UPI002AADF3B3|nr:glycoside hydrolase family 3 N-terminal domain-containing protein [Aureibaculum sp. 2210JD6-5]MDY7395192.1 glycoside hydrolase family 3 N-terminal domain-containing protein [Aureibaculum sp. 2210JD6-5]